MVKRSSRLEARKVEYRPTVEELLAGNPTLPLAAAAVTLGAGLAGAAWWATRDGGKVGGGAQVPPAPGTGGLELPPLPSLPAPSPPTPEPSGPPPAVSQHLEQALAASGLRLLRDGGAFSIYRQDGHLTDVAIARLRQNWAMVQGHPAYAHWKPVVDYYATEPGVERYVTDPFQRLPAGWFGGATQPAASPPGTTNPPPAQATAPAMPGYAQGPTPRPGKPWFLPDWPGLEKIPGTPIVVPTQGAVTVNAGAETPALLHTLAWLGQDATLGTASRLAGGLFGYAAGLTQQVGFGRDPKLEAEQAKAADDFRNLKGPIPKPDNYWTRPADVKSWNELGLIDAGVRWWG